jgi:hypothetical protein
MVKYLVVSPLNIPTNQDSARTSAINVAVRMGPFLSTRSPYHLGGKESVSLLWLPAPAGAQLVAAVAILSHVRQPQAKEGGRTAVGWMQFTLQKPCHMR